MSDQRNIPTLGFKNIKFKVKKEPWNRYSLVDGSELIVKFILLNYFMEKNIDEISSEDIDEDKSLLGPAHFGSTIVTDAISPEKIRGPPSDLKDKKYEDHITIDDVDVIETAEYWNEYKFENGITLKAKNILINVSKTDLYNSGGMPIYLVHNNITMKMILPKKIRDKLRKK